MFWAVHFGFAELVHQHELFPSLSFRICLLAPLCYMEEARWPKANLSRANQLLPCNYNGSWESSGDDQHQIGHLKPAKKTVHSALDPYLFLITHRKTYFVKWTSANVSFWITLVSMSMRCTNMFVYYSEH